MGYVKHKEYDSVYGLFIDGLFSQHKWQSLNTKVKEGIARGDIGQFVHLPPKPVIMDDYIEITEDEYASLYTADYNKLK